MEGHNNATVKAFYDYLKGPRLRKSLNVTDLQPSNDTDRSEWQAVLLSLKVSSLAVLFSCRLGSFLPGYWCVARFRAKLARQRTASTAGVTARGRRLLILVSMGRRGFIGERLYDWFGLPSPLAGAARFSLPPSCRFRDGAGNSSGAGRS